MSRQYRLLALQKPISSDQTSTSAGMMTTLAKASFAFLGALLLWEVVLRLAVESSPGSRVHPVLGKIERPGVLMQRWEGAAQVHLNRLGMRTEEILPKTAHEYRILILGDSFARGDEVSDPEHFATLLEKNLVNSLIEQRTASVVNAGKPGASPANYIYGTDFYQSVINPDSVVVLLTAHDFTMDMMNPTSEFYTRPMGNAFQVVKNQGLGSDHALANLAINQIPQLRAFLQLSVLRVGGKQLHRSIAEFDQAPTPSALAATPESYDPKQDEALVAWTLQQLDQMTPNLVVVYIPAINYQNVRFEAENPEDSRNLQIEAYITQQAHQQQIPLINMRSAFVDFYQTQSQELRGFNNTQPGLGHLNANGHRLIADQLIKFYRDQADQ